MEIDELIQEKKSELKGAFAAAGKAHELAEAARGRVQALLLDVGDSRAESGELSLATARLRDLESAQRDAEMHFHRVSDELTQLHRQKYGSWHVVWTGNPRP